VQAQAEAAAQAAADEASATPVQGTETAIETADAEGKS
jgi:hypothetical protein